jgi:hypothetical protein
MVLLEVIRIDDISEKRSIDNILGIVTFNG